MAILGVWDHNIGNYSQRSLLAPGHENTGEAFAEQSRRQNGATRCVLGSYSSSPPAMNTGLLLWN